MGGSHAQLGLVALVCDRRRCRVGAPRQRADAQRGRRAISATFSSSAHTTTYTLGPGNDTSDARVTWSRPNCRTFAPSASDQRIFVWQHPHPPCDPTTSHDGTALVAEVRGPGFVATCRYRGAETGTGPPCEVAAATAPATTTTIPTSTPPVVSTADTSTAGPTGGSSGDLASGAIHPLVLIAVIVWLTRGRLVQLTGGTRTNLRDRDWITGLPKGDIDVSRRWLPRPATPPATLV